MEQTDESVCLTVPSCNRSDAGQYTIKATNKHGECSEQLQVIVLTSPTEPQGPLEVGLWCVCCPNNANHDAVQIWACDLSFDDLVNIYLKSLWFRSKEP